MCRGHSWFWVLASVFWGVVFQVKTPCQAASHPFIIKVIHWCHYDLLDHWCNQPWCQPCILNMKNSAAVPPQIFTHMLLLICFYLVYGQLFFSCAGGQIFHSWQSNCCQPGAWRPPPCFLSRTLFYCIAGLYWRTLQTWNSMLWWYVWVSLDFMWL